MPGMNYDQVSWLADQTDTAATTLESGGTRVGEAPSLGSRRSTL